MFNLSYDLYRKSEVLDPAFVRAGVMYRRCMSKNKAKEVYSSQRLAIVVVVVFFVYMWKSCGCV